MAGVDLAPSVDDADHRFAGDIFAAVADLLQPRPVGETGRAFGNEPALAAQVFRFAFRHVVNYPIQYVRRRRRRR